MPRTAEVLPGQAGPCGVQEKDGMTGMVPPMVYFRNAKAPAHKSSRESLSTQDHPDPARFCSGSVISVISGDSDEEADGTSSPRTSSALKALQQVAANGGVEEQPTSSRGQRVRMGATQAGAGSQSGTGGASPRLQPLDSLEELDIDGDDFEGDAALELPEWLKITQQPNQASLTKGDKGGVEDDDSASDSGLSDISQT